MPKTLFSIMQGEDLSVVALEASGYIVQLNNDRSPIAWNKVTLNLFINRLPS